MKMLPGGKLGRSHANFKKWKQEAGGLAITSPAEMPFATAVTFRVE